MSDTRSPSSLLLAALAIDHERIHLELLTVDAAIAEAARAFHADGVSQPMSIRSEMLARQKRLALELYTLKAKQRQEKSKALDVKAQSFLGSLLDRCIAAGRTDLVEQARADAVKAVVNAGLLDAYRL